MQAVCLLAAVFLSMNLVAGLWRIAQGPTTADRMLAAQLLGTTAVGILLLLAQAGDMPAGRDVALVLALLAAVTAVSFVRRAWPPTEAGHDPD